MATSPPTVPPPQAINSPPIGASAEFTLNEDSSLRATLPRATDPDGDPVTFVLLDAPLLGQLQIEPGGAFSYAPDADFNGVDTFSYEVTDGKGGRNEYTVRLAVQPVNDSPVVSRPIDKHTSSTGATVSLTLPADTFFDVDGDPLAWTAQRADGRPLPGWLAFDATTLTFTARPASSDLGTVALRVTAADASSTASTPFEWTVATLSPRAISGVVAGGYVGGARIFLDSNGNGMPEPFEATGLSTDPQGRFSGTVYGEGRLIAVGGADAFHGAPNPLLLSAPAGTTLLTPLTTLIDSMMVNQGLSAAAAQSAIRQSFDLPPGLDLLGYDPQANPAGDEVAVKVQRVAVQLSLIAATMEDTAGAMRLIGAKVSGGMPLDLSSASVVRGLFSALEVDPRLPAAVAEATRLTFFQNSVSDLLSAQGDEMPRLRDWKPALETPQMLAQALIAPGGGVVIDPGSARVLFGVGIDPMTLQSAASVGYFSGGLAGVDLGAGVILTTGNATPPTRNLSADWGAPLQAYPGGPTPQDSDLQAAAQTAAPRVGRVVDTSAIEFSFTVTDPSARFVQLDAVFASEAFRERMEGGFGDVAAVWVNGRSIALLGGQASQPGIDAWSGLGSGVFIDNTEGAIRIEYDAVSQRLSIAGPVSQGRNTIKIAIGDVGDAANDSALIVSNLSLVRDAPTGVLRVIEGSSADDVLQGGEGADRILLGEGNDVASGFGGNDWIRGGAGDDTLDGGSGIDTAQFSVPRSAATLSRDTNGWTVRSAADGVDTLIGVERLAFSDMRVALDLDGNAGTVARLLGALFGPAATSNRVYAGIGLELLDSGTSAAELAALAVATDEFARLAGGRSNAQFVELVYRNVVGTAPSEAERALYVGWLDRGEQTQGSLALLAAETPLTAQSIDLVGLAAGGLPYDPMSV
jgi:hypothetical protein